LFYTMTDYVFWFGDQFLTLKFTQKDNILSKEQAIEVSVNED